MSAQIVFGLRTQKNKDEIENELKERWNGEYVDVFRPAEEEVDIELLCDIAFVTGDDDERIQIESIARYLQSVSEDKYIWYYRGRDCVADCRASDVVLNVSDIFSKDYEPGFVDGVWYRYKLE